MSKALRCDICGILFEQPKYYTTTLVVEIDHESNLLKRTDCCPECAKHIKLLMTGLRSKVPTCMELFEREHPNLIPNAKKLGGYLSCPYVYGYIPKEYGLCDGTCGNDTKCAACWDQLTTRKE